MNVKFEFTSTTTFDQLKVGDVFLANGNYPYMKIKTITEQDVQWAMGEFADVEYNAVSLGYDAGMPESFENDDKVFPCPNASIRF